MKSREKEGRKEGRMVVKEVKEGGAGRRCRKGETRRKGGRQVA